MPDIAPSSELLVTGLFGAGLIIAVVVESACRCFPKVARNLLPTRSAPSVLSVLVEPQKAHQPSEGVRVASYGGKSALGSRRSVRKP